MVNRVKFCVFTQSKTHKIQTSITSVIYFNLQKIIVNKPVGFECCEIERTDGSLVPRPSLASLSGPKQARKAWELLVYPTAIQPRSQGLRDILKSGR